MTEWPSPMAEDIAEQEDVFRRALDSMRPERPSIWVAGRRRRRVLFAGRGSTDNSMRYGRYLMEVHAGIQSGLVANSVATFYKKELDLSDTVVVITSSDDSPALLTVGEWARAGGAVTIAVTDNPETRLAALCDVALCHGAGRERAETATKSFLAELVAMVIIATALTEDETSLDHQLERVPGELKRLLSLQAGVGEAIAALSSARDIVVAGRGFMMHTAMEIALKIEENCRRPVRGLSYVDLGRGPIRAVSEGMVALLVSAMDGPMLEQMTVTAKELRHRGAHVVGIGGDPAFANACEVWAQGPDLPEVLAPIGAIVPGQLIVEGLARVAVAPPLPSASGPTT